MKTFLIFTLIAVLVNMSACNKSADLTMKANDLLISSKNTNVNKSLINSDTQSVLKNDSSELKSKYPLIFSGFVNLENHKVSISSDGWTLVNTDLLEQLEQKESPVVNDETTIKVDVMNCAGYLGSAFARYDSGNGAYWKVEMISETIPSDLLEKFNQCSGDKTAVKSDSITMSSAFAIESQNNKRRNIKINQVDTRKLFASLPEEIKKQLNNKFNAETREQNNLSLGKDKWTDIDGDGQIDLIDLSTNCGNYECGLILYLLKGKWLRIGEVQPA